MCRFKRGHVHGLTGLAPEKIARLGSGLGIWPEFFSPSVLAQGPERVPDQNSLTIRFMIRQRSKVDIVLRKRRVKVSNGICQRPLSYVRMFERVTPVTA